MGNSEFFLFCVFHKVVKYSLYIHLEKQHAGL